MDKYSLKITSAVVVDGEIRKANSIVTVDERVATDLLRRGKAVPAATEDEQPVADAPEAVEDAEAKPKKAKKDVPAKSAEASAE